MIRNLFEAVSLLKAAPEKLKNFQELLDYARNIYKDATGVFPDGIDFLTLKNAAREVANIRDPNKVVKFPGSSKDLSMKTPGGQIPYIESPTRTI